MSSSARRRCDFAGVLRAKVNGDVAEMNQKGGEINPGDGLPLGGPRAPAEKLTENFFALFLRGNSDRKGSVWLFKRVFFEKNAIKK
jgi:hypothetical protein